MIKRLHHLLSRLDAGGEAATAVEALMDAAPAPTLVTDTDEIVVLANATACARLALPAREIAGRPLGLLLREMTGKPGADPVGEARPIRSTSGEVVGHVHILRAGENEQERTETEALTTRICEMEEAIAKLRTLESTRNHVLSNVSHELRTPLVTIIGYTEMISALELGDVPDEVTGALRVVLRNALRLSSRIDDLLNLSRLQEEELRPHSESLFLGALISSVLSEHHLLIEDKDIDIQTDVPKGLPPARADRRLLTIAFENLLKNAVKFSPNRGRIRIEAAAKEDVLRVTVTDEGPGIPTDHLERVFEPFFQVDSSPTRVYAGIGLGLPIVRRIAEAHGGKVLLQSDGRQGTTAVLDLPLDP